MNLKFWQKRSLENPCEPITGAAWLPTDNSSMVAVSEQNAWTYSAVWAAVKLISETIAQLPLELYIASDGKRRPATNHRLYDVIRNSPSERYSSFAWRETQQAHTLTWGNGYAFIQRDDMGNASGLALTNPGSTGVYINDDGTYFYQATIDSKHYRIDPADMLHIAGLGFDGLQGKSPIKLHRETIGLSMSSTKFGAQFFGNGTNWGGVIKHPATLKGPAKENLANSMKKFKGAGYSGLMILDEGMDYQRIGIPPDDAQFLETRRFQVSEIARIYNVPNHMLNDLEKSSFNNISELSKSFLRYTMSPWLVKWEHELNRKLLTESERNAGYYFKFNAGGLLRGTQAERYESYGKAINDGWLSRNEVRELEDRDPVDGLDEYLVPLNMGSGQDGEEAPDTEPATEDTEPASRNYAPIVERSAESFAAWLADVDKRSTDTQDRARRLNSKLATMTERYINPVLLAAGVPDGIQRWGDWLESQPADKFPEASAITAALTEIIGEHHGT